MNIKIETWLPVFPGFYGTIFEPDEEQEMSYINEEREGLGLPEAEFDEFEFDYEGYSEEVSEGATSFIADYLKDYVTTIENQKVNSPREYNFANDSVNIMVELSPENIAKIQSTIESSPRFESYLKGKYKSYDGFMSHYSYYRSDWVLDSFQDSINHPHKLGSLLEFLCWELAIENDDELEMEMYYQATEDTYLYCTNYDKLAPESKTATR